MLWREEGGRVAGPYCRRCPPPFHSFDAAMSPSEAASAQLPTFLVYNHRRKVRARGEGGERCKLPSLGPGSIVPPYPPHCPGLLLPRDPPRVVPPFPLLPPR